MRYTYATVVPPLRPDRAGDRVELDVEDRRALAMGLTRALPEVTLARALTGMSADLERVLAEPR